MQGVNLAKEVEKLVLLILYIFVKNLAKVFVFVPGHLALGDGALWKNSGVFVLHMSVKRWVGKVGLAAAAEVVARAGSASRPASLFPFVVLCV